MSFAHKGSILPIRNVIIPISQDDVLFHFDDHLMSTRLLEPERGLLLDGTNDWVEINGVTTHIVGNKFTVELWVKTTVTANKAIWAINTSTGSNRVLCYINNNITGHPTLQNSAGTDVDCNVAINDGKWHHLAVVHDSGTTTFYVDGIQAGSGSQSISIASSDTFSIGQEFDGATPSDFFPGTVYEFRVWNIVRTPSEIVSNMRKELNGNEHGLQGYWKFDDNSGTVVKDYTQNGNNGTVNGGATWVQVATLRPGEGKFGGAVAVEEGTTNAFVNPWTWQNWNAASNQGSECDIEVVDVDGIPTLHIYNVVQPTNTTYPRVQGPVFDDSMTGDLAASFYAWSTGGGQLSFRFYAGSNTRWQNTFSIDGTRRRYVMTTNTEENLTRGYFVPQEGHEYWIQMPQLEEKTFATSFVDGARDAGALNYNLGGVISPQQGTLAFWYEPRKPAAAILDQPSAPKILQVGTYFQNSSFTLFGIPNSGNEPVLTLLVKGQTDSGWSETSALKASGSGWYTVGTPMFLVVTWEEGHNFKCYLNGELLNTTPITIADPMTSFAGGTVVGLGTPLASAPGNGLYDEFLILDRAATEDEICSWYESQAPFYDPYGYYSLS